MRVLKIEMFVVDEQFFQVIVNYARKLTDLTLNEGVLLNILDLVKHSSLKIFRANSEKIETLKKMEFPFEIICAQV